MKFTSRYNFVLVGLMAFTTNAFADWSAPIQCGVETKIGESKSQIQSLSGMTEARLLKKVTTSTLSPDGEMIKEDFNYEIYVRLTSTNTYTLSIKDLNQNTVVSQQAIVPYGSSDLREMELRKDYSSVNGMSALFPEFNIELKCQLRSQGSSGVPELTPGPPPQM
ncbi:MAG: hypothetical protein AAGB31_16060 [Bdellovibrio sp.]